MTIPSDLTDTDPTGADPTGTGELGQRLLVAVARLNRWATRHAGVRDSVAALRLLATVDELGLPRIGDLARADSCSQPTVTGQVGRLERAGWVRRVTDPDDARAVRVALTPEGSQRLVEIRAARAAAVLPRLDRLTERQRTTLADAVAILEELAAPTSLEEVAR
ncbi:MAG: MarR family transcriptional regulator [Nocardioidaceae bacterium]